MERKIKKKNKEKKRNNKQTGEKCIHMNCDRIKPLVCIHDSTLYSIRRASSTNRFQC